MSTRTFSRHIPDFRLVTHFAETGTSVVHAANPWTKAGLLLCVIAFATILTDVYLLLVLFIVSFACYVAGRLPVLVLFGWYTLPLMFVVTLAIMFVFTEPGEVVASFGLFGGTIALTDNGILLLVKLLLRALAVVTFSLAVFMTTRYTHMVHMASKTLPGPLASIFLLSYRFMFVTADEVSGVLDAIRSRNGTIVRGLTRQTRMFAGIFGLAFVHAFERAERIAKAMDARGFMGRFPIVSQPSLPSARGYAILALAVVLLVLATYSRYFDPELFGW